MNSRTLHLPRLVAGRDFADDMISGFGGVIDEDVIIDGTRLVSGTSSFAAQLIEQLLVRGGARSVLLVGAPTDFASYSTDAAHELGVIDRFDMAEQYPDSAAAS